MGGRVAKEGRGVHALGADCAHANLRFSGACGTTAFPHQPSSPQRRRLLSTPIRWGRAAHSKPRQLGWSLTGRLLVLMTVLGESKGQDVRSLLLRARLRVEGHEASRWGVSPSSALAE